MKRMSFGLLRIILIAFFIVVIGLILYLLDVEFNVLSFTFWIPIFYGDSLGTLLALFLKKEHKPGMLSKAVIQIILFPLYVLLFWRTPASSYWMLLLHLFVISALLAMIELVLKKRFSSET